MTLPSGPLWLVLVLAVMAANARWLRVAQREHYEPGRATAIALLWCQSRPVNTIVLFVSVVALVVGLSRSIFTLGGLVLLVAWPFGLVTRPTTSPLAWTPRFRRLTAVVLITETAIAFIARQPEWGAFLAVLVVPIAEMALRVLQPLEKKLSRHFVRDAQARLKRIHPITVAITGSYGKTSTKLYAAHLLSGTHSTVASPASFNNLMGLSRAVNDRLLPSTEVFIAEMGTYAIGEIRELCTIFPPTVAAITTIGEAHFERMRNRAAIVSAKTEITERAETVVLNVDVPELADLAARIGSQKRVIRCSTTGSKHDEVTVHEAPGEWRIVVEGRPIARVPAPSAGHPINLSIALGIAMALGVNEDSLVARLADLPTAPHRAEIQRTAGGVVVVDDTYNSNPEGAAKALGTAAALADGAGRIFTVTPGMIELGVHQFDRNKAFASKATATPNMTLAVIGRTNRKALEAGVTGSGTLRWYRNRQTATDTIMEEVRSGDVVLYENDLPDHYP